MPSQFTPIALSLQRCVLWELQRQARRELVATILRRKGAFVSNILAFEVN